MNFKQLYQKIGESKETFISYGRVAHFQDSKLTLNGVIVGEKFDSLEEAKEYCKASYISEKLEQDIKSETYEELEENRIAKIINEHHNIKVTDTLIESYIELASSKLFTVDPVVSDIRKLNKLDHILEGKLDYRLSDGTTIIISEALQENLNNLLKDQKEIIEYMRESKENFMHVLELIEE